MKRFLLFFLCAFFCFTNLNGQVQLGQNILTNQRSAFGSSVSISSNGNRVAIGAPGNNTMAGYVEVYQFNPEICEWVLVDERITDNELGANFGSSVSLSANGTRLAIGSPNSGRRDVANRGRGRIHIYDETVGWQRLASRDGPGSGSSFGSSVFLSGDGNVLAVGAYQPFGGTGQVHVYRENRDWVLDASMDIINGRDSLSGFGFSVSLSDNGDRIAIGAVNHRSNQRGGYFQVFDFSDDSWSPLLLEGATEARAIFGESSHDNDRFGQHVSITGNGNWVAVGSSWFNNPPANGNIEIFSINGDRILRQTPSLTGEGNEHLGFSVSLSNENRDGIAFMAVGGPYFDPAGSTSGPGRVRRYLIPDLDQDGFPEDIIGNQPNGRFGSSVSISAMGNRIAVGAPSGIGFVQVFDLNPFICPEDCCAGENLIVNGDFEDGDDSFESDYAPSDDLPRPGQYSVVSGTNFTPPCANWDIEPCFNGENNSIMVVNGQTQRCCIEANAIWQTPEYIEVEESAQYNFCFQVFHLSTCCFDIQPQVRIEVRPEGEQWMPVSEWLPVNTNPGLDCDWVNIESTFTANFTSVKIRVTLDESGNGDGNDLALDNMSLANCQ